MQKQAILEKLQKLGLEINEYGYFSIGSIAAAEGLPDPNSVEGEINHWNTYKEKLLNDTALAFDVERLNMNTAIDISSIWNATDPYIKLCTSSGANDFAGVNGTTWHLDGVVYFNSKVPGPDEGDGGDPPGTPDPPTLTAEYQTKYYLMQPDGTYELEETVTASDVLGKTVSAVQKVFPGHVVNESAGSLTGIVTANHVLVLEVYYDIADTCVVTYKDGYSEEGEDILLEKTVYAGAKTPTVAEPTREGYRFTGWDHEVQDNVTVDATYIAQWKPKQYTITFDTRGGTAIDPIKQNYDTAVTAPAAPTKEGYDFAGWDKAIPGKMPAEDMTITASWTEKSGYQVIYDYNYPENTVTAKPENKTVTGVKWTDKIDMPAAAPEGYTFVGWNTKAGGSGVGITDDTAYCDVAANDAVSSITLYAQWEIEEYTYTVEHYWMQGDGTYAESTDDKEIKTVDYNTIVTAQAKKKSGFAFDSEHSGNVMQATVTGDGTVLKLYYTRVYTVKWINADGTVLEKDENVAYGTTPSYDGETPTKAATAQYTYTFAGWDPEIAVVTGDVTYTATYSEAVNKYFYAVKYYFDGVENIALAVEKGPVDYGTKTTYDALTAEHTKDYVFDKVDGNNVAVTGAGQVVSVYYAKDVIGGGDGGEDPSEVADKYEIVVYYKSESETKGAVTKPYEVFNTLDADKDGSKVSKYGTGYAIKTEGSTAVPVGNYAFLVWTQKTNDGLAEYKDDYAATIPAASRMAYAGDVITFTAYFTPKTTPLDPDSKAAGYFTEYYLEKDGAYVLEDKDYAVAKIGDTVKVDDETVTDKYKELGYTLDIAAEGTKLSGEVYKPSAKDGVLDILTLKLYYSADVISEGKDEETEKSDRIPDKYQVTVLYKSEQGGEIVDIEKEVLTLTDKDGNYVTKADVKASGSEVERDSSKYRFRGWTADSDKCRLENDDEYELDAFVIEDAEGGKTYTITADFDRKSSNKDKDDDDDKKKPALNTEEHFQYIMGYPDGTVGPLDQITRAEVASIFYRLLDDETREYYFTTENAFPDMNESMWYNKAVSTLANAGIITGCSDGLFHGGRTITRAELATIIAKFDEDIYVGHDFFTDIAGHWARPYINVAAENGWIVGDGNALFRPYDAITRAEVMTMINAVLEREVDADGLCKGYKKWSDNIEGKWYYYQVIEATNYHEYVVEKNDSEKWIKILEDKTWDEAGIK